MKIVITVGLPGCGKTTYLARLGVNALSSDDVRRVLADDPRDQTIHRRVFATIRYLLAQRAAIGRPVTYVDATHLTRRERRPYLRFGELHECEVEAIYFDTPLEVCLERNRLRDRVVPESAILDMARRMSAPSVDEGFSRIEVVRF